jgi:alpha-beta hydrolase superfamily lysophospholipase
VSRARWVAVAALGLVLVGVGGGIGLPYRREVGWCVQAVVGIFGLIVGLGLAALATVLLVRSVGGWRKIPMVVGIAAAALIVVPALSTAVAASHVPPTNLADVDPATLGLTVRDVTFRTPDGVRLSGWYVPSTNGDAVVLLHGSGGTRTSVLRHAPALAQLGYGVLLYDARGHGRSDGRAMDLGWYGDDDVGGAVAFVRRQPDAAGGRVLAVGISMGGAQALGALPVVPELCAVVAEGVTARTGADTAWRSDVHGVAGFLEEGLDQITYRLTDLLTPASAPRSLRSAVAAAGRPVLLIAAQRVGDEPSAAAHIAAGAPRTVTVWTVPGAAHGGAFEARRGEWLERVGRFLAEAQC